MLDRFERFIKENDLCSRDDKILVALSGGLDSVVLLRLFLKAGYDVAAAHCNFLLRGPESDGDERFVRDLCEKWGVELFVRSCPAEKYSKQEKLTIQEAARELRYGFFEELIKTKNFSKIAVAHHADDDLETFFINFFRGSGVSGLKGIPVARDRIIRPLLPFERKELETFAQNEHLSWREDSSNSSDKYLRNRIRHHLLPVVEKLVESKKGIKESLAFLKDDAFLLEQLLEEKKKELITVTDDLIEIRIDEVGDERLRRPLLYHLIRDYGFNGSDAVEINNALEQNVTGVLFFSGDHELVVNRGHLLIRKRVQREAGEYLINNEVRFLEKPFKAQWEILTFHDLNKEELKDPEKAFFDLDKLTFPLVLRKWKKGDRFIPFGMKGSKLISDLLIDLKVDAFQKENVWLLLSGREIIWVVGYRISDKVKVTGKTETVLKISLL
jgi:tRNA(Ile)-lysidine synthase